MMIHATMHPSILTKYLQTLYKPWALAIDKTSELLDIARHVQHFLNQPLLSLSNIPTGDTVVGEMLLASGRTICVRFYLVLWAP